MKTIIVGLLLLAVVGCSATGKSEAPEFSFDGLALKSQEDFDAVYVDAAVKVSDYKKVMLMPGTIAFKKDWMRDYNRSTGVNEMVTEKDMATIKARLSKLLYESFKQSLSDQTTLEFVDEEAEGVLLLKPSIINLDVNAPDINRGARDRTFVDSLGEATLFLEGFDSVSGDILVRVIDRSKDRESGFFQYANRATNTAEAKRMINRWSDKFNDLLALARSGE